MTSINRRHFIFQAGGIGFLPLIGCQTTKENQSRLANYGGEKRIRRNLWKLASDDPTLSDYASAVEKLKALPPSDPRHWTNLAGIHRDSCPHGNSFFFPWHRLYLHDFETVCSQILGKPFSIPYWDWCQSTGIHPALLNPQSPLFHPNRDITKPEESMVQLLRHYQADEEDIWSSENVSKIQKSTTFLNYLGRVTPKPAVRPRDVLIAQRQTGTGGPDGAVGGALESSPHNLTHVYVGGDMNSMMSPLDPIFYLHHANIDRIWTEWCLENPTRILPTNKNERNFWLYFNLLGLFYQTNPNNMFQSSGTYTVVFEKPIQQVLSTDLLNYQYDTTASKVQPRASQASSPVASDVRVILEAETVGLVPKILKNIITFEVPLKDPKSSKVVEMIKRFEGKDYREATLSFQAIGMSPPNNKRAMLEFYIDHPNLTPPAIRQSQSPYFIGRLGFFGHDHGDHVINASFDLTQPLEQLRKAGWVLGSTVKLQIVIRGTLDREPQNYSSTRLRLEYIETPKNAP